MDVRSAGADGDQRPPWTDEALRTGSELRLPAGMEDVGVANGDHSPVVDLQDGEAGVLGQLLLLLL